MLPTTAPSVHTHDYAFIGRAQPMTRAPRRRTAFASQQFVPEYLWRALHVDQMDLEYTYSQMVNLLRSPSEVYKSTKIRKQIKNQWSRDDPAFVCLLIVFIFMASLGFSICFGVSSFWHFARIVLGSVLIEFLGTGVVIASVCRYLANRYMRVQRVHAVDQDVEWLYAFDIHCNGFWGVFVCLFVVQYFLSPILLTQGFVSLLLGNTLYAFAFCYYHYVTFLGYSALPFLHSTQKLLHPIGLIIVAFILSLVFKFNVFRFVMTIYFGTIPQGKVGEIASSGLLGTSADLTGVVNATLGV